MASRKKRPHSPKIDTRPEGSGAGGGALPRSHQEKMEHNPFSAALSNLKVEKKAKPKPEQRRAPRQEPLAARPREAPAGRGAVEGAARSNELGHHSYDDRVSFREAMRGVKPLGEAPPKRKHKRAPEVRRGRIEPEKRKEADADAMAQLDALVQPEHRFRFEKDGGFVRALREGAHASHLGALAEGFVPEASLDLHGLRGDDAEREILRFIRAKHQEGRRQLLIIHGRGRGSAGGAGVLGGVVTDTLSRTGLSKIVLAFASAPRHLGGEGAIVVRLGER